MAVLQELDFCSRPLPRPAALASARDSKGRDNINPVNPFYFVFCVLYFVFCIFYVLFSIFYFLFCILYFLFPIFYFLFCILYFLFCISYFLFCILYFLFSIFYFLLPTFYFYFLFSTFYFLFSIPYSLLLFFKSARVSVQLQGDLDSRRRECGAPCDGRTHPRNAAALGWPHGRDGRGRADGDIAGRRPRHRHRAGCLVPERLASRGAPAAATHCGMIESLFSFLFSSFIYLFIPPHPILSYFISF